MYKRGTSLVEVLMAVLLTAMIVGAVSAIYGFATARAAHTVANQNSTEQSTRLLDAIESSIRNAVTCDLVNIGGQSVLRCTMPANGTDTDGDGVDDRFDVLSVGRRGTDKWGTGQRVWYFIADSSGVPGTTGTIPWRAVRNDSSVISSGDVDRKWTYPYGGTRCAFGQITSLTYTINATYHVVTVSVAAGTLIRASRTPANDEPSMSDSSSLKRIAYWRNWRQ